MSTVFVVGRSKLYGEDLEFPKVDRVTSEPLRNGIKIVSADTLERFMGILETVNRPHALILKYYLPSDNPIMHQGVFGEGPINKPEYNIGHLINSIYDPASQNTDLASRLYGVPTLIFDGLLHEGRTLPSAANNHQNVYINGDTGNLRHNMRGLPIPSGNIGDRIMVGWINKVLGGEK